MSERFAEWLSRRTVDEEKWTSRCFRKLASLYRKSPCLWKKDAVGYLDSERRHRAYAQIHRAMDLPGVTFVEIVLKIREMRRVYVEELRRVLEKASRGRRYQTTLPWFYDLHRFLYPYLDYDEAVELHNETRPESRGTEEREPEPIPSNCSCVRRSISSRNLRNSSPSIASRRFAAQTSNSTPAVSLPEVKTRPRTCPRLSCGRITDRKQLGRFSPRSRSSRCYEKRERHEDTTKGESTRWRQEKRHEFTICGLHDESSSEDTDDSESDRLEAFSTTMMRYLKRMDKAHALKAQTEIQRILKDMLNESKGPVEGETAVQIPEAGVPVKNAALFQTQPGEMYSKTPARYRRAPFARAYQVTLINIAKKARRVARVAGRGA
ncbi:unnamed protein product [Xylocopa violacea]|uniref:MADF domain-containing protein n=1 Tax=Xylocopa violacea TaxID=135666 RepID=A0ABP1PBW4_XYLVO